LAEKWDGRKIDLEPMNSMGCRANQGEPPWGESNFHNFQLAIRAEITFRFHLAVCN
jgi:hypothetical protein